MARPTKYTEELLERAREYVDSPPSDDDVVHSIAGLAIHLGIARDTVHAWAKDPEKGIFSDIVDDVLAKQERRLLAGGLTGGYNASIAKLMLTKHGYADKVENDNRHAIDLSHLSDEELQAIAGQG